MAQVDFSPVSDKAAFAVTQLLRTNSKLLLIFAIGVLDAIWIYAGSFTFDTASVLTAVLVCALMLGISYVYTVKRPNPHLATGCYQTAALLSFTAVASVLSYLVTSLNLPLIDQSLIYADSVLGFDWTNYVAFVNERPLLGTLSSLVYMTTLSQVALTVIMLSFAKDPTGAARFVSAVMIGALVCIAISGLFPAAGALATIRPPESFLHANSPFVDLAYKQTFFDLRSGVLSLISLQGAKGLIAFPSYHCTLSMLVVLAFWKMRWLFVPVAVLNLCVLLSTPVDGGHHMIDGLAGALVAGFSWWWAGRITSRANSPSNA